jgi:hypothetical protein
LYLAVLTEAAHLVDLPAENQRLREAWQHLGPALEVSELWNERYQELFSA